jgi:hypothetical protein
MQDMLVRLYEELAFPELRIEGLMLNVRLVQFDDDENFFTVNMFVNKLNNFTKTLSIGGRIAGIVML